MSWVPQPVFRGLGFRVSLSDDAAIGIIILIFRLRTALRAAVRILVQSKSSCKFSRLQVVSSWGRMLSGLPNTNASPRLAACCHSKIQMSTGHETSHRTS